MIFIRTSIHTVHLSNRDWCLPPFIPLSSTRQGLPLPRRVSLLAFLQTVPWSGCLQANQVSLHRLTLPLFLLTTQGSWPATSSSLLLFNFHYTLSPSKSHLFWGLAQAFFSYSVKLPAFSFLSSEYLLFGLHGLTIMKPVSNIQLVCLSFHGCQLVPILVPWEVAN